MHAGPASTTQRPAGNPWLERRPLHIAHQGGALEAPANTLYAFTTAAAKGAHSLELDVHATADGHVVVLHDDTVDRTTDGTGRVAEMSLSEVRALDAAYRFVPGTGTVADAPAAQCPLRGVATGDVPPPAGFAPEQFRIPTLAQVLESFPDRFVNIDIKNTAPHVLPYEEKVAELLTRSGRSADVIVGSFIDRALDRFAALAPTVSTAAGPRDATAFWNAAQAGQKASPAWRHHALQVPTVHQGTVVVSDAFVAHAHACGVAVHVWTVDEREEMQRLLDMGVDGVVTDRPTVLAEVLSTRRSRQH